MRYDAFSASDPLLTSALLQLCVAQGGWGCTSSRLLSLLCKLYDIAVCRVQQVTCAYIVL